MNKKIIIYQQGRYVPVDSVYLDSLVPGMNSVPGVFETLRIYEGKVFAFDDHILRMQRGCRFYGKSEPLRPEQIKRIIVQLLKKNSLKDARVRISLDLKNATMIVVCVPLKKIPREKYIQGYRASIASQKRRKAQLSNVKTLQYEDFLNAYKEAKRKSCDEALFLNAQEKVIEGSRTNLFRIQKNILSTPPIADGCLNGITRQHVLRVARSLGLKTMIRSVSLKDLQASDEIFLTNSIIEIMPVASVEGQKISSGKFIQSLSLKKAFEIYVQKSLKSLC